VDFIQLIYLYPVPRSGPGTSTPEPIEFFLANLIAYCLVILYNYPTE
jgi:hypothetical protein